jgi:hypothetical protein
MKRDMDLIRRILLDVEEKAGSNPIKSFDLAIPGYSPEVVSHHVLLLQQAGLLTAVNFSSSDGFDVRPKALTWDGHEFLASARNDTVWNKVKDQVKEKLTSVPFEVFKALLLKAAAAAFGLGIAFNAGLFP